METIISHWVGNLAFLPSLLVFQIKKEIKRKWPSVSILESYMLSLSPGLGPLVISCSCGYILPQTGWFNTAERPFPAVLVTLRSYIKQAVGPRPSEGFRDDSFLVSRSFLVDPDMPGLWQHFSSPCFHLHMVIFPLCLCVHLSSYKDAHITCRAHHDPG